MTTYTDRAQCLRAGIFSHLFVFLEDRAEEFRDTGWRGYDLDGAKNNFEHNAIVFVDGRWQIVDQDNNLWFICAVSLDTLCEYADYIMKKYKL